ncbi:hypothetical protein BTVI_118551 [Pitangus sulphuratus]|nr:hypothetical protein BTVI_118551 [Pitangus sulphuratus]
MLQCLNIVLAERERPKTEIMIQGVASLVLATQFLIQARKPLAFWAHCWLMFNQHPQVFIRQVVFLTPCHKPVVLRGAVVTQGQDLAPDLIGPHAIDLVPSIQSVQIPLQSLPALQQINAPAQLGIVVHA